MASCVAPVKSGGSKEGGDGFRIAAASHSLPMIKGEFSNSPPGSTIPRQVIAVLGLEEWLGIRIMVTNEGVRIVSVTLDGPADTAGLQRNDVITKIDGQPVGTGDVARDAVINAIKAVKARERSSIVFTVIRPDRPLKLTIKRAGEPPVTTR
jgi:S1-C subfamily serine protease